MKNKQTRKSRDMLIIIPSLYFILFQKGRELLEFLGSRFQ